MKLFNSLLCSIFLLFGCQESNVEYSAYHRAEINPVQIDDIEKFVRAFAAENELRVFDKSSRSMQTLSMGDKAFFIALYREDELVLNISNVGVSSLLSIGTFSSHVENESVRSMEQLSGDLRNALSFEFNIKFVEIDPQTSKKRE